MDSQIRVGSCLEVSRSKQFESGSKHSLSQTKLQLGSAEIPSTTSKEVPVKQCL